MRRPGAIPAGGQARRFGRDEDGFVCLPDHPQAGMGPLGGLNAALWHAATNGFTHVLSAGVDAPDLPHDLKDALAGEGAVIVKSQSVVGLWPAALYEDLGACLKDGVERFMASPSACTRGAQHSHSR